MYVSVGSVYNLLTYHLWFSPPLGLWLLSGVVSRVQPNFVSPTHFLCVFTVRCISRW